MRLAFRVTSDLRPVSGQYECADYESACCRGVRAPATGKKSLLKWLGTSTQNVLFCQVTSMKSRDIRNVSTQTVIFTIGAPLAKT